MIVPRMPDDFQERLADYRATEKRLKIELDDARKKYDGASVEFYEAADRARELGLSTVDGSHAMNQASKCHRVATEAYGKSVQRFSNFILRGIYPAANK